jgi:N-carbamoyl-L-amino-acid hydrolase
MEIRIDIDRLSQQLETLAAFSDSPPPSVTRVLYTPTDLAAREYLKGLCREAGLEVREDPLGNTFARWVGQDPQAGVVGTGSHIDAIPHAGRYDGTVGVLGGLEAIRALQAAGFRPKRSLELLIFTSEEPTRFGIGCLGSRLLSGALSPEAARALRDAEGVGLEEARRQAGFGGELGQVPLPQGYHAAFVELHIEQGPILEREGVPLGLVTAIAAPAAGWFELEGQGGHAGAVLMPERKDAFTAAAELALAVEQAARQSGSPDTVATTGICEVFPGAVNSIPSRVRLSLDLRDTRLETRERAFAQIQQHAERIRRERGVEVRYTPTNADPPARSDPRVLEALRHAAQACGLPYLEMVSRAYHDALFMARIAPTAMLFIPCKQGWSHRPDEYAAPEHIEQGVRVLAHVLAELAGRGS